MRKLTTIPIAILLLAFGGTLSASASDSAFKGARWIGAPWQGEAFDKTAANPAPVFRKVFDLEKEVSKASVSICGLGFFELSVNGTKIGDDVLVPAESSYTYRPGLENNAILPLDGEHLRGYRVYYLNYDVAARLRKGSNELRVIVGNGFFSTDSRRHVKSYGSPRLICRLDVTYRGGGRKTVVSDLDFEVAESPIRMNDIYDGEIYDARLEGKENWMAPVLREAPTGELELQTGPTDKVTDVLRPMSVKRAGNGDWVVDFGYSITGWVRFKALNGLSAGQQIDVIYDSEEGGNGIERYYASGSGLPESYHPRFTWYTFRKVTVRGLKDLQPSFICADVVHSAVGKTGQFECSNSMLNRFNGMYVRTQLDNMHLCVPTDCPHRERGPYTGDGQVSCVAAMHNLDMRAFYRKWLRDISDCQNTLTGYVPNGAPWHMSCGGGVPWGSAINIIPWEYYVHYGDVSVLKEHYFAMTEQLRFMLSWRREDGTMEQRFTDASGKPLYWMNLGEWCSPYEKPEQSLVHTYFLWKCADVTARAARVLGKRDDALRYGELADDVARAFIRRYYHPESGSFGHNDGADVFALAMGLPDDIKARVLESLVKDITGNGGHLNTGIYSTALLFEVLCDNGLGDLAYSIVNKTDYPSYGHWLVQGADTLWEQWDGKHSHNHPMFGGGLVWFYTRIAGLRADPDAPGYKHFIVRPYPVGDLTHASYSTWTRFGEVSVRWIRDNGFHLRVRVPRGTRATVYLPGDPDRGISVGPGCHEF